MAFSLNRIELIGNLGQDAETRITSNNNSVTSFSIATVNSYKGKDDNWNNETTWHNVVSWNLSDYMKDQLKKGRKFYVAGRLQKRDYEDKEGIKRYVVEVLAEQIIPLEKSDGSNSLAGGSLSGRRDDNSSSNNSNDDLPF